MKVEQPAAAGTTPADPATEYRRRLEERRACAARFEHWHIRLGNLKLVVAAAGVLIAWLALGRGAWSAWWLLAPAATLMALAILHQRVIQKHRCAERAVAFYDQGLARIENRWAGQGVAGERFADPHHPYGGDLDIFGKGSLFELLCTGRTRTGEETLARWLLDPAPPEEIRARQAAIAELRPQVARREELTLVGEDLRSGINPQALAAWCEGPPVLVSPAARVTAAALALLAVAGALVWAVWNFPGAFLLVLLAETTFSLRLRARAQKVVRSIGEPAYGLELLHLLLVRFEREHFSSPRLLELQASFKTRSTPPSRQIARLHHLTELLDSRDNLVVRLIGPPLLWTTQVALAIEAWRAASGAEVRRWLAVVGEIETLYALAGYSFEHPSDPFPELLEGPACFEGEGLGHPLLPQARSVSNDVRLGPDLKLLVVSGPNMSGKSTLLRTVGINAVLAMAGAPVRARRLRLSPLAAGTCIRVQDSLQTGASHLYAEITRLRKLRDMVSGPPPLLFLLDELLHDTNAHDRALGAEAFVCDLAVQGAIGLLTTHDLALAHIADVLAPHAANVHFEDQLEDGRISFDYRLRPGIARKSNALELMRSVGLDV
jgi:hypothetical protein